MVHLGLVRPAARQRVLRLCLRFEVEPMLIPPAKPERQGSIENFNGWMQSAQGYLTHCLNAYDANPVWTADPARIPGHDHLGLVKLHPRRA